MFWFSLSAGYGNHKWDHLQSTVSLSPHFIDAGSGYQQLGTTACLSVLLNFWLAFSHLACVGSGHQQLGTTTCTPVLFEFFIFFQISLTFYFLLKKGGLAHPHPLLCTSRLFWPSTTALSPRSNLCSHPCSCLRFFSDLLMDHSLLSGIWVYIQHHLPFSPRPCYPGLDF